MKHIGLFVLFLASQLHGMTSRQAVDIIRSTATNAALAVSNAAPGTTVQSEPVPLSGAAQVVAVGSFARPAIGVYEGVVTISAEGSGQASVWCYTLQGDKWVGGQKVTGSKATAARTYGLSVAAGVTAYRYGPKTGGTWQGPGLFLNGREIRTQLTTGAARLAMDGGRLILMSKDSNWGEIDRQTGTILRRGKFAALSTGEKLAFTVSSSGVWVVGMNGYSKQAASVAVGNDKGGTVTAVAAYEAYPEMGSDLVYCDVAAAADGSVWYASVFKQRLRVQQVKAGRVTWPISALADIGSAVQRERCPPRLAAVGNSVFAFWTAPGGKIAVAEVSKADKGKATAVTVCAGSMPAVAVSGRIVHMAYIDGGKLVYRTWEK